MEELTKEEVELIESQDAHDEPDVAEPEEVVVPREAC